MCSAEPMLCLLCCCQHPTVPYDAASFKPIASYTTSIFIKVNYVYCCILTMSRPILKNML